MKFQEIIKHHIDSIYGGWDDIKIVEIGNYKGKALHLNRDNQDSLIIMIEELLSPESGFLQACNRLRNNLIDNICENPRRNEECGLLSDWVYRKDDREYHAMRLSILSQEEKIKYLEDNVIVE